MGRYRVAIIVAGAVPLLLQALHEAVDVLVQVRPLCLGPHLRHPRGGILPEVAPALFQEVLVAPPVEVAAPLALLTCGLLRDARPGGGPWGPILPGRAMFPVQAP